MLFWCCAILWDDSAQVGNGTGYPWVFPWVFVALCSFSAQDKKNQAISLCKKWVSYSHFKCRDHSSCAPFILNKSVSQGTKIFKNLADFSVCPKDLHNWGKGSSEAMVSKFEQWISHSLLDGIVWFFFVLSTGWKATSFQTKTHGKCRFHLLM